MEKLPPKRVTGAIARQAFREILKVEPPPELALKSQIIRVPCELSLHAPRFVFRQINDVVGAMMRRELGMYADVRDGDPARHAVRFKPGKRTFKARQRERRRNVLRRREEDRRYKARHRGEIKVRAREHSERVAIEQAAAYELLQELGILPTNEAEHDDDTRNTE